MKETVLLTTKLQIPPPCQTLVCRPRLAAALSKALTSRLTLVSAPAGYGKTTLVSNWLRELEVPSAWLTLDEEDDDPVRFLQYFLTALQKIIPTIRIDWLAMLPGMQPARYLALMSELINEIAEQAAPFVLALDDFHLIHSQPILEALLFLLEHAPPQMHLVVLTRTDPLLPLSRLRVRGQMVEIRADQLRFRPEEIALYLSVTMGLKLSAAEIAALEARTEGWIAALQLAAISLKGCKDSRNFVSAFTGSHHYLMDYLTEEVLRQQPESVRSFLLQTSILDRLCGPLCEAVVQPDANEGAAGQAMLELLSHKNLFLIPGDDQQRWFRYHHLFADVLTRRLEGQSPGLLPILHRRASRWYEQNGWMHAAIQHALAAGDRDRAARLVDQHGCILLMEGEVVNLLGWIEAVEPDSQVLPWVAIQKAWALALTGQLDQVEPALQAAERLVPAGEAGGEVGTMRGAICAARAYRANLLGEASLAADLARQALGHLPASTDFSCSLRSAATSILGDASFLSGSLAEAGQAYAEAARVGRAAGNMPMAIIANANLADTWLEQGQLQKAGRIYTQALQMAALPDEKISPLAERLYAGLSRVAYEWNHLEAAEEYAHRCIELSRRWGGVEFEAACCLVLAKLEHIRSNREKVVEMLRAAEALTGERTMGPWQSSRLQAALARGWIAQGNLEKAADLVRASGITFESAGEAGIPPGGGIPARHEPMVLSLLRLLLARGEEDAALALSMRWLQKAEQAHRLGWAIEILVLQALIWQPKDLERATAVLQEALALAQPEGYVRTFLDEGEPMAKLLYRVKARRTGSGYEDELLDALGQVSRAEPPAAAGLIEPLTGRELEVLKLIEAGWANQDIAHRLVISIPTVKRHISNIYAKLGAKSRTQAVSLGRELRLFK